jgi:hypothetical protein
MTYDEAVKIRKSLKKFWKELKKVEAETSTENASRGSNYSWQHYAGLNGVADYRSFPELTNSKLIAFFTKDTASKLYPTEEEAEDFDYIIWE